LIWINAGSKARAIKEAVYNRKGEADQMDWGNISNRRAFIFGILGAGSFIAIATLLSQSASAQMDKVQMDKVQTSMAALKAKTASLGPPRIEGTEAVGGKEAPALYFGTTKMNNHFDVVDEVVNENGGTATIFVKSGDDYVRVATNVKKDDGSRAIGTILDPNGPVIVVIRKGEAYYGDATILGKPYTTGYDPIRDISGSVIGIYYVGYLKG
jgi:Cache 3/Cache 2 fusion domain